MVLHRQHFTQFVTIILAIFGIGIGIYYKFQNEAELLLIASICLFFNSFLSFVAIKVCNRFYRRFLESVTIANKLYFILNECFNIDSKAKECKEMLSEDCRLFPNRWINALKKSNKSDKKNPKDSKEPNGFVEDHMNKGVNRWIQIVFLSLIILNTAIGIILLIIAADLLINMS